MKDWKFLPDIHSKVCCTFAAFNKLITRQELDLCLTNLYMRKLTLLTASFLLALSTFAQDKKPKNVQRAADHFMIQISNDSWLGLPDSIKDQKKGFSRGMNVYVMLDKPFKKNSQFSIGFGLGVSTSNVFFDKMKVDITGNTPQLAFISLEGESYYKKYKVSTTHLEVPVELRFTQDPTTPNKSIKGALGLKVGTILKAQTKGKELRNTNGNVISSSTFKESNKEYFNATRISVTGRVGYGIFSLHGAYSLSSLFKDGVGPDVNTLQIGLTISGL